MDPPPLHLPRRPLPPHLLRPPRPHGRLQHDLGRDRQRNRSLEFLHRSPQNRQTIQVFNVLRAGWDRGDGVFGVWAGWLGAVLLAY